MEAAVFTILVYLVGVVLGAVLGACVVVLVNWKIVRGNIMKKMLKKTVITVLLLLFGPIIMNAQENPTHIHGADGIPDWYDASCCSQKDCHPIAEGDEVEEVVGRKVDAYDEDAGTYTTYILRGWKYTREDDAVAYYSGPQIKPSHDGRFHVCHSAQTRTVDNGQEFTAAYCIYIPLFGSNDIEIRSGL